MSDNDANAATAPAPEQASAAPSGATPPESGTQPSEPQAPPAPVAPPYVFGADAEVPAYLKGKTREQLAQEYTQLYGALQTGTGLPPNMQQPQQGYQPQSYAPAPPPAAPQPQMPTQDDWLNDPAAATEMRLKAERAQLEQKYQTGMEQQWRFNAEQAKQTARILYKDEFDRWGPEIEMQLSRVAPQYINAALIADAVDMVRGKHAREIAEETIAARAEEMLQAKLASANGRPGAPGGGSANSANVLDLEDAEIPLEKAMRLKELRIDQPVLDSFLTKTGEVAKHGSLEAARAAYLKRLKNGSAIVAEESQ